MDQLNYVSRVTLPVLMLNGRYDAIEPVETAQRPMFERLGTPKDRKKWVVYDDGHSLAVRRNEVVKEALDWLDRYLGPDQLIRRLYRLPPPSGGPESFLKQEV